jgi:transposase
VTRRRLDERIEGLSADITNLVERDPACVRVMTVLGIGPIISIATVAAIGTGDVFSKGRDFAAWLGLVPRQISTGDRTILGRWALPIAFTALSRKNALIVEPISRTYWNSAHHTNRLALRLCHLLPLQKVRLA